MLLNRVRSFGAKVVLLAVFASGLAVALQGLIFVVFQWLELRPAALQNITAHANLLTAYSAAPLSFEDKDAGNEFLQTLERLPSVDAARLYDKEKLPFAEYERRPHSFEWPDAPPPEGHQFAHRRLILSKPVVHRGESLGTLLIVYDLGEYYSRIYRNSFILFVVAAVATGLAFVLAQRLKADLTRPMATLVATAREIGHTKNYDLRSPVAGDDEVAELSRSFNQMLDQLQRGEASLRRANEELRTKAESMASMIEDLDMRRVQLEKEIAVRTAVERELAEKNSALAQKSSEMEQFVYSVSHDLKSPLVTIKGFLGLLKAVIAKGATEKVPHYISRIEDAGNHMIHSIDDLLMLSRIGRIPAEPAPLPVTPLVLEIVEAHGKAIADANIQVSIAPDMPTIFADRRLMTHVFDNLIGNAIKYGCDVPNPTITIGCEPDGDRATFFVRDHGSGIAPEYHEFIFGLFQRLKTDKEGTGVGLATVRRVAELMGGKTWVESQLGEGAAFKFSVPIAGLPKSLSTAPIGV